MFAQPAFAVESEKLLLGFDVPSAMVNAGMFSNDVCV